MGSEYIPLSSGKKRMEPLPDQTRRLKNPALPPGEIKNPKTKPQAKKAAKERFFSYTTIYHKKGFLYSC
jgi:hypothetical protein